MDAQRDSRPTAELDARFSDPAASTTSWEDVVELLESAELFWISTVRANGHPHVTPLPAVWRDPALYFCTGPTEQKAVNLAAVPDCVLTNPAKNGKNIGKSDTVGPGKSTTLTVTLQSGDYVFYCSIGNHRTMGMETTVSVS